MMREAMFVTICGGLGSLGRYGLSEWLNRRFPGFPYATLLVNVTGSLALGLALGLALSGRLSHEWRVALGAGFLGGFTTFSTFSAETVALARDGRMAAAGANMALNLGIGVIAAWLGFALTAPE